MSNLIIPLKYNILPDYSSIKNILLVDDKVKSYNEFVDNCNSLTFPIVYNYNSSSQELVNFLTTNFASVDRLCFVFDGSSIATNKPFVDNKPFFTNNDLKESNLENMSDNFKLIVNLCTQFKIQNLDFLACNSLKYKKWIDYYNLVISHTKTNTNNKGVTIGASDNKTGNVKYGGDWILESTGEYIQPVYFTNGIDKYHFTLLNGTIQGTGIAYVRMSGPEYQYQFNSTSDNG